MGDDVNAERSKLLNRQKKERTELEKDVKKKKGALKDAAQAKLDELDEKHAAELAEFDSMHSSGGAKKSAGSGGYASSKVPEAPAAEEAPPKPSSSSKKGDTSIRERNWSSLSKKELEEECVKRGIGKKGSKEDLVVKLTCWHSEAVKETAEPAKGSAGDPKEDEESDEEDDDDDEEEDDDGEESEEDPAQSKDPDEAEKQFKREQAVGKAIKVILSKPENQEGFKLEDLPEKLASVNVKNFSPQICGYSTLERFVRKQPERHLRYKKSTQMILPPKK